MRPELFLRIASGLTFVHAALHTVGGVFGKPAPGAQQAVTAVMQSTRFQVMGDLTRTFWDFYFGMGLAVSVFLTAEAVILWQLSALAKTDALRIRPLLATFLLGYLCLAVVTYTYIFTAPAVTEILIALCLGLAIFRSSPASKALAG